MGHPVLFGWLMVCALLAIVFPTLSEERMGHPVLFGWLVGALLAIVFPTLSEERMGHPVLFGWLMGLRTADDCFSHPF